MLSKACATRLRERGGVVGVRPPGVAGVRAVPPAAPPLLQRLAPALRLVRLPLHKRAHARPPHLLQLLCMPHQRRPQAHMHRPHRSPACPCPETSSLKHYSSYSMGSCTAIVPCLGLPLRLVLLCHQRLTSCVPWGFSVCGCMVYKHTLAPRAASMYRAATGLRAPPTSCRTAHARVSVQAGLHQHPT